MIDTSFHAMYGYAVEPPPPYSAISLAEHEDAPGHENDDPLSLVSTGPPDDDDPFDIVISGLDNPACSPTGVSPVEAQVIKHEHVKFVEDVNGDGSYSLEQFFAIVRHADRLDRTPAWESYAGREAFPNDTPLSQDGHGHASNVGKELKDMEKPFGLIIASPYLRCAQTASRIAQELQLPVQFDLDLGEVFDRDCMGPNAKGPQHRNPDDLEAELKPDFPDVAWIRDENNAIKIEGRQQEFPESLDDARMRFVFKVQQLVQKAASELMSLVIVTHGDALGAVLGMIRYDWKIQRVPYASYAVASRQVAVLDKGSLELKTEEPVYEQPEQWNLQLSEGVEVTEVNSCSKKRASLLQKHQLKKIGSNTSLSSIDSSYLHKVSSLSSMSGMSSDSMDHESCEEPESPKEPLSPDSHLSQQATFEHELLPDPPCLSLTDDRVIGFMETLSGFGANSSVSARLVRLAGFSYHMAGASMHRMSSPVNSPRSRNSRTFFDTRTRALTRIATA